MATVKTTVEDRGLPIDKLIEAVARAVNTTLDQVDKHFQDTCSTFNHKPTFHKEYANYSGSTNMVTAKEWTDDENYVRLNYGTSPHDVNKPLGSVVYMGYGYRRKTQPGRIKASTGGYAGKHFRTKTANWHPSSFPARNFDETIANHARPFLRRVIELELRKIK